MQSDKLTAQILLNDLRRWETALADFQKSLQDDSDRQTEHILAQECAAAQARYDDFGHRTGVWKLEDDDEEWSQIGYPFYGN